MKTKLATAFVVFLSCMMLLTVVDAKAATVDGHVSIYGVEVFKKSQLSKKQLTEMRQMATGFSRITVTETKQTITNTVNFNASAGYVVGNGKKAKIKRGYFKLRTKHRPTKLTLYSTAHEKLKVFKINKAKHLKLVYKFSLADYLDKI